MIRAYEKMAQWHDQHAECFVGDEPWRRQQREFHERTAADLRQKVKSTGVEMEKPILSGLYRDNPETPEGKYLVKRRDGTVPEWPSFVLGGKDPAAAVALRAYADAANKLRYAPGFVGAIYKLADAYDAYRMEHGDGDADRGRHRVDDPATVEEMKKGRSA